MAKSGSKATALYQNKMPITTKNLGKNHFKTGQGTQPHQGNREIERRLRKEEKRLEKLLKQKGHL